MERLLDSLNGMSEEDRKYVIFLLYLKTNGDHQKEEEISKFLIENNIKILSSYFNAFLSNVYKKEVLNMANIDELFIANENYQIILEKAKHLAIELNLSSSLELANLYTYLLWNGYFSKDKVLVFQQEKRKLIPFHHSFEIMNGIGVCLDFSSMLTDFINKFEYSSANIINIFDLKMKSNYAPPVERKVEKMSILNKMLDKIIAPIGNISGNHVFNLINENDKLYIYDSTNLKIFSINNKYSCSNVCGTGKFKIKPYFSYVLNNADKSEEVLYKLNTNSSFQMPCTRKDYILTCEECFEQFEDSKKLLDDFHDEIVENINCINDNSIIIKKLMKNGRMKS